MLSVSSLAAAQTKQGGRQSCDAFCASQRCELAVGRNKNACLQRCAANCRAKRSGKQ
jgi:hypothetical protein